jgi:hypothetical protein
VHKKPPFNGIYLDDDDLYGQAEPLPASLQAALAEAEASKNVRAQFVKEETARRLVESKQSQKRADAKHASDTVKRAAYNARRRDRRAAAKAAKVSLN